MSLHPQELDATAVPAASRWHVSSGIAHPADDGTPWCRVPHLALCPARTAPTPLTPQIAALRRHLALHTRRLLDTGTLTPLTPEAASPPTGPEPCRPARPIVLVLHTRYLAAQPVDTVQCVAQTRLRHRCTHPVLSPSAPVGTWTLVPATTGRRRLALRDGLMAVYDLTHLTYAEQLRWRHQRCPHHGAAPGAADLAFCEWEPFDPLLHHRHVHNRLPATARQPHPGTGMRTTHDTRSRELDRDGAPGPVPAPAPYRDPDVGTPAAEDAQRLDTALE